MTPLRDIQRITWPEVSLISFLITTVFMCPVRDLEAVQAEIYCPETFAVKSESMIPGGWKKAGEFPLFLRGMSIYQRPERGTAFPPDEETPSYSVWRIGPESAPFTYLYCSYEGVNHVLEKKLTDVKSEWECREDYVPGEFIGGRRKIKRAGCKG